MSLALGEAAAGSEKQTFSMEQIPRCAIENGMNDTFFRRWLHATAEGLVIQGDFIRSGSIAVRSKQAVVSLRNVPVALACGAFQTGAVENCQRALLKIDEPGMLKGL